MIPLIRNMVPFQDGEVSEQDEQGLDDPAANARAIKAMSYMLGADLTGICEIPSYAWYSHRNDGTSITPYHKYAVVCQLIAEISDDGSVWIFAVYKKV